MITPPTDMTSLFDLVETIIKPHREIIDKNDQVRYYPRQNCRYYIADLVAGWSNDRSNILRKQQYVQFYGDEINGLGLLLSKILRGSDQGVFICPSQAEIDEYSKDQQLVVLAGQLNRRLLSKSFRTKEKFIDLEPLPEHQQTKILEFLVDMAIKYNPYYQ